MKLAATLIGSVLFVSASLANAATVPTPVIAEYAFRGTLQHALPVPGDPTMAYAAGSTLVGSFSWYTIEPEGYALVTSTQGRFRPLSLTLAIDNGGSAEQLLSITESRLERPNPSSLLLRWNSLNDSTWHLTFDDDSQITQTGSSNTGWSGLFVFEPALARDPLLCCYLPTEDQVVNFAFAGLSIAVPGFSQRFLVNIDEATAVLPTPVPIAQTPLPAAALLFLSALAALGMAYWRRPARSEASQTA